MGFDLLLAMMISYYMVRNTVQDLVFKARGEDPPSYRREMERLRRKESRRPITERREARRFFANAWHDAWESAGERREQMRERRRDKRQLGDEIDHAEREAHKRNATFDEAEDEAYRRNDPLQRCDRCHRQVVAGELSLRVTDTEPEMLCASCVVLHDERTRRGAATRPDLPVLPQPRPMPGPPEPPPADPGPAPDPASGQDSPGWRCGRCERQIASDKLTLRESGEQPVLLCPACVLLHDYAHRGQADTGQGAAQGTGANPEPPPYGDDGDDRDGEFAKTVPAVLSCEGCARETTTRVECIHQGEPVLLCLACAELFDARAARADCDHATTDEELRACQACQERLALARYQGLWLCFECAEAADRREPDVVGPLLVPCSGCAHGYAAVRADLWWLCEDCAARLAAARQASAQNTTQTTDQSDSGADNPAAAGQDDQDGDGYALADTSAPSPSQDDAPSEPGAEPGAETPIAQVIQLNAWHDPQEEPMAETTNLNAALTYVTQMAGSTEAGAASVETSIASMQAGGVSGPAINNLITAQEALQTANAAFKSAHEHLTRHISVQEAYAANRDAGNKRFVTSD